MEHKIITKRRFLFRTVSLTALLLLIIAIVLLLEKNDWSMESEYCSDKESSESYLSDLDQTQEILLQGISKVTTEKERQFLPNCNVEDFSLPKKETQFLQCYRALSINLGLPDISSEGREKIQFCLKRICRQNRFRNVEVCSNS